MRNPHKLKTHKIILRCIFRSFFASPRHMPSYVRPSPQHSPKRSRASFIRKVGIMHDKLNDAVEIVNYSFSCEVSSIPPPQSLADLNFLEIIFLLSSSHSHASCCPEWSTLASPTFSHHFSPFEWSRIRRETDSSSAVLI